MGKRKVALYHAFHTSLPIMAGYGFLGLTYGIYMHELGFNFLYPMLLAITVYAGSAEFLLSNMLLGSFHPLQALLMVLMVNARHLFYGLSMLEKYKGLGWKKFFLIFGMSGQTFALASTSKIPEGTDRGWYLLWITWLDETYWVIGATLGGLIGPFLSFDLKGFLGAGGSRSLHHPHPRMEKEYDVVDSSKHPLLYAAHQNSTLLIPIKPSHTYIT